jgi:hypothetical protein
MIPGLQKINPIVRDEVNDPMLLGQAARPGPRENVLQGLGLPDPRERLSQKRLDELEQAQGDLSIVLNPELQILTKLRMKDGLTPLRHREESAWSAFPDFQTCRFTKLTNGFRRDFPQARAPQRGEKPLRVSR